MNRILFVLSILLMTTMSGLAQDKTAPKGKLIYCSYARNGHAGQGKDYCELIADVGKRPQVVVSLHNDCFYRDAVKKTFDVTEKDVERMQQILAEQKVYLLDGYKYDESLEGGATYRIYQEYASGDTVNAVWSGHNIKTEASAAYAAIERFFAPWRSKVEPQE
ncbi:MAG: hypothetical protein IJ633_00085 [Prevotella sp.]|nr:hypothetical protein [Prevotella sp.]